MKFIKKVLLTGLAVLMPFSSAMAGELAQEWELINPQGEIEKIVYAPAARLDTLAGKTVVLRWNSKPNGDVFLDRLAELLAERLPDTTIIKAYEVEPATVIQTANMSQAEQVTNRLIGLGPDLVIGSQGD